MRDAGSDAERRCFGGRRSLEAGGAAKLLGVNSVEVCACRRQPLQGGVRTSTARRWCAAHSNLRAFLNMQRPRISMALGCAAASCCDEACEPARGSTRVAALNPTWHTSWLEAALVTLMPRALAARRAFNAVHHRRAAGKTTGRHTEVRPLLQLTRVPLGYGRRRVQCNHIHVTNNKEWHLWQRPLHGLTRLPLGCSADGCGASGALKIRSTGTNRMKHTMHTTTSAAAGQRLKFSSGVGFDGSTRCTAPAAPLRAKELRV